MKTINLSADLESEYCLVLWGLSKYIIVAPDMPDDRNTKQKFISESGTINVISALQVYNLDNIAISKVRAYQAVASNDTLIKFPSKQVEGLDWFQKWFFQHVSLLNEQKVFLNTSVNAYNGIFSDTSILLPFGTK